MVFQKRISIQTKKRELINITQEVFEHVTNANIDTGICNVFLQHTSASLILCENADPVVLRDLEVFMQALVPDGNALFQHNAEGPDDMPSHIRSVLTTNVLTIPVINSQLGLGTWQGIYLWEHRYHGHNRKLIITLIGD